jgi:hypothetical protein
MAIDVEWQDESGQVLARYEGPPLGITLYELAGQGSTCLRFIDPYGDTTFNQSQVEVLIEELRNIRQQSKDRELNDLLDALLGFVAQAHGQIHTYVKFIGD